MTRGRQPKVVRIIEEYDLPNLGGEVEDRWTSPDPENRASLRQLAREINLRLLESALSDTAEQPLDGEVENLYHLLTDDDVSSKARTQARAQIEQYGVDVEQLVDDFVSRQAVHTYLTSHRDVSSPQSDTSPAERRTDRLQSVQRLRSRLESVTRSVLTKLRAADNLTLGEFSVVVAVRIHCADCGARIPVRTLLESGSCDCESDPP
jgi:Rad3-related DNA helicase